MGQRNTTAKIEQPAPQPAQFHRDAAVKLCLLGSERTGKSTYVKTLLGQMLPNAYTPTIGVDFSLLLKEVAGRLRKFHIWDTCGEQRFHCMMPTYLRNAQVCLIFYDPSLPQSFDVMRSQTAAICAADDPPWILIFAQQLDADAPVLVPRDEVVAWMRSVGIAMTDRGLPLPKSLYHDTYHSIPAAAVQLELAPAHAMEVDWKAQFRLEQELSTVRNFVQVDALRRPESVAASFDCVLKMVERKVQFLDSAPQQQKITLEPPKQIVY